MKKVNLFLALGGVWMSAVALSAEPTPKPWNMGFSLSFPKGTGPAENVVKDGFGLDFNCGYQQPTRTIGYRMDVLYSSFRLSDPVIARLDNATEGYFIVFGGGPSVVISPPVSKWVRPSLYAGPGLYHEHAEATWDDSCDPTFGCATGDSYNTTGTNTTRLGWQGGAGLDFLVDGGAAAICLNVQWVHIDNTHTDMEFIPINIGYKVMF